MHRVSQIVSDITRRPFARSESASCFRPLTYLQYQSILLITSFHVITIYYLECLINPDMFCRDKTFHFRQAHSDTQRHPIGINAQIGNCWSRPLPTGFSSFAMCRRPEKYLNDSLYLWQTVGYTNLNPQWIFEPLGETFFKKKLLNCYEMLIHELLVCNWYVINIPWHFLDL